MGLFSKKKQSQPQPPGYAQGKGNKSRPVPSSSPSGRQDGRSRHHPAPNVNPVPFQPAGYLPPPPQAQSWNQTRPVGPPPSVPYHGHNQGHYGPIIVNQHYYMSPPTLPPPPPPRLTNGNGCALTQLKLNSTSDLVQLPINVINQLVDDGLPSWHAYGSQLLNQSAALYDQISSKFDDVMTLIDGDKLKGHENELFMYQQPSSANPSSSPVVSTSRPAAPKGGQGKKSRKDAAPKGQTSPVAASLITGGYFSKVDLYANSRLPLDLPPFRM